MSVDLGWPTRCCFEKPAVPTLQVNSIVNLTSIVTTKTRARRRRHGAHTRVFATSYAVSSHTVDIDCDNAGSALSANNPNPELPVGTMHDLHTHIPTHHTTTEVTRTRTPDTTHKSWKSYIQELHCSFPVRSLFLSLLNKYPCGLHAHTRVCVQATVSCSTSVIPRSFTRARPRPKGTAPNHPTCSASCPCFRVHRGGVPTFSTSCLTFGSTASQLAPPFASTPPSF
jgi:hypothetical protein